MRESREGVEEGWLVLFDGVWLSRKARVVIFYSRLVDMSAKMLWGLGGQQEDCQGRRGGTRGKWPLDTVSPQEQALIAHGGWLNSDVILEEVIVF